jgi:hypothetical protein
MAGVWGRRPLSDAASAARCPDADASACCDQALQRSRHAARPPTRWTCSSPAATTSTTTTTRTTTTSATNVLNTRCDPWAVSRTLAVHEIGHAHAGVAVARVGTSRRWASAASSRVQAAQQHQLLLIQLLWCKQVYLDASRLILMHLRNNFAFLRSCQLSLLTCAFVSASANVVSKCEYVMGKDGTQNNGQTECAREGVKFAVHSVASRRKCTHAPSRRHTSL